MSEKLANPGPIGLMGFGTTTVLLNLHNAGILDNTSLGPILSMGLFYGGLAQMTAGHWEIKKGNTFAGLAFNSFGWFWITLVLIRIFPKLGWFDSPSPVSMAAYLFIWGTFTGIMTISTFKLNKVLQVIFVTLTMLFYLLALGDFTSATNPALGTAIIRFAGYLGLLCGSSAIYLAAAELTNEIYGKTILPIGD
jgi:hypothetical protein